MKHLVAILICIFVLSFGPNVFAFPAMGDDCTACHSDWGSDDQSDWGNDDQSGWGNDDQSDWGNDDQSDWGDDDQSDWGDDDQEENNVPGCGSSDGSFPSGCDTFPTPRDHGCNHTPCDHDCNLTPCNHGCGSSDQDIPTDGSGCDAFTPPDRSFDDSQNQDDASQSDQDDSSFPSNPWENSSRRKDRRNNDNSSDNDTPTAVAGTLTVSGSGFSPSGDMPIGILSLPADTTVGASLIGQRNKVVEGVIGGMIQADGSIVNILSESMPLTLMDITLTSPATLSGGEHLVVALIDNEPSITDLKNFSDIGDNDMVAVTTVTINGDTSLTINYDTLTWTPFGNL